MRVACAVTIVVLSAGILAQAVLPACPADLPVDEIIAEIHKAQGKKNSRNKNPLPNGICIGTWCLGAKTPPTVPEPAPRDEGRNRPNEVPESPNDAPTRPTEADGGGNTGGSGESSSKHPANECNLAMELVLEAAHNVEVGDYYFVDKNYRAAMLRYQEASEQKPADVAVRVRLGRAFEKLNDGSKAIEQYEAATKMPATEKWSDEARKNLERLQRRERR